MHLSGGAPGGPAHYPVQPSAPGAAGLRTTQFSILAKLRRLGPMTINALAHELVIGPHHAWSKHLAAHPRGPSGRRA